MNKLIYLLLLSIFVSCNSLSIDRKQKLKTTTIVTIIGFEYYNITFDELGNGVAKKGMINNREDSCYCKNVNDSLSFILKSTSEYFRKLRKYEKKPYNSPKMLNEYNVKIYVNNDKIYDSYKFDADFWDLIKSVGKEIPIEFNTFVHNSE